MSTPERKPVLITPVFRARFVNVFTPAPPMKNAVPNPNAKPKYQVCAIWTPALFTPEEKARWTAIIAACNEVSKKHYQTNFSQMPQVCKRPIRDGAEKAHLAGFGPGTYFSNLSTHIAPSVVAADGKTKITDAQKLYDGCYMRASVGPYHYKNIAQGVALGMNNLKFIKDGDRLNDNAEADFADLGEADIDPTAGFGDSDAGNEFL